MARFAALLVLVTLGYGCAPAGGERAARPVGDANTVEQADVEGRYIRRIEDMLRGQVAGVDVQQTPSGLAIRIRGSSSSGFGMTTSDPLFVVDGLPIQLGADGALAGLNPRDVQSIRVLKNASETALYGSRGANGVILITTRRPPPPRRDP